MTNINGLKIKDQELLNNHLYIIFVENLVTHKRREMMIKTITLIETMTVIYTTKTIAPITEIDTEVTAETIHKIFIDLILDKNITIDLQVHISLDFDTIIIIKEELHLDLHIDHHTEIIQTIDTIPDPDIDLVLNHKETPSDDIIIHTDLHLDQEISDQDLEHLHRIENKIE